MAIITGLMRLGRDAEVKQTSGGDPVANLALAYNYGKKVDGKQPTQWVDAALWGKRAEALAQYLTKGTAVVVTLSDPYIKTFTKQDGTQSSVIAGQVIDIAFAGGPAKSEDKPKPAPAPVSSAGGGFASDDIPFAPRSWKEG